MAAKAKEQEEIQFTKYEKARLLGSRALQLAMGAPFLIKFKEEDLDELSYNPMAIARRELEAGAIPITVKRLNPHER